MTTADSFTLTRVSRKRNDAGNHSYQVSYGTAAERLHLNHIFSTVSGASVQQARANWLEILAQRHAERLRRDEATRDLVRAKVSMALSGNGTVEIDPVEDEDGNVNVMPYIRAAGAIGLAAETHRTANGKRWLRIAQDREGLNKLKALLDRRSTCPDAQR